MQIIPATIPMSNYWMHYLNRNFMVYLIFIYVTIPTFFINGEPDKTLLDTDDLYHLSDRGASRLAINIKTIIHSSLPAPIAQLVECPLRGTGGHAFDPGPRHTKVVKNGTSCSSLGTQTYGVVVRTGRPSVRIMWLGVLSCQVSGTWYFSEAAL